MDSGTMQMLGATGGMVMMFLSVLMMILSILVPFFVWRIWKWTYTTSQELQRLNEKFDQLLALQQGESSAISAPAPAVTTAPPAAAAWTDEPVDEPAPEEAVEEAPPTESTDPLASAFDTTDAAPAASDDAFSTEEDPAAEESGFEFSVSPEDAFGEDAADESGGFEFGEDEPAEEEAIEDPFAEGEEEPAAQDDDFSFDAEEDSEVANLNQEFDNAFAQADDPAAETEETTADPFGEFDDEGSEDEATEEEATEEDDFSMSEADKEEPFAEQALEEEPVEEEQPDIIPLDPDPKRPTVSLARCGKCDHKLAYKESLSGKKARCPSCQSAFVLP